MQHTVRTLRAPRAAREIVSDLEFRMKTPLRRNGAKIEAPFLAEGEIRDQERSRPRSTSMLACGRDTRSARQIMPTDIGTPRLLAPLLHRPCAVPPMCTQFMVQAWRPYQQRIASASISDDKRRCWRTELPPASFGIGDTLGLVVPLAAEALLNDAALDVMVSVTGEVASSVYATLGMLREKDARAQCSPLSAKKISHEQTRTH